MDYMAGHTKRGRNFLFGLPVIHRKSTVLIHLLIIYALLFIHFFKFDTLLYNMKMELQIYIKKNFTKNLDCARSLGVETKWSRCPCLAISLCKRSLGVTVVVTVPLLCYLLARVELYCRARQTYQTVTLMEGL